MSGRPTCRKAYRTRLSRRGVTKPHIYRCPYFGDRWVCALAGVGEAFGKNPRQAYDYIMVSIPPYTLNMGKLVKGVMIWGER